jgi:Zn-finger nucleic acid-binding protein
MEPLLGADDGTAFDLECPHCKWAMTKVDVASITLDRCSRCGGIWLDLRELQIARKADARALVQADQSYQSDAEGRHKPRHCPRDKSLLITMVDQKQKQIEFESCTVCGGIFFDAGELSDLSEFTLRERFNKWFG